jgi:glycosyltransferase involved in cell wall biosynthesis
MLLEARAVNLVNEAAKRPKNGLQPMRILFFYQGRIVDWAGAVLNGLRQQFPMAEFSCFDVHAMVKERPTLLIGTLFAVVTRYGRDLLLKRRDLDDAFFTTPYLFHRIRSLSAAIQRRQRADFSFQMHSMHDHSFGGTPHFVYTDFTYHSCRASKAYGHARWAPARSDRIIGLEREIYSAAATTFVQSKNVAETLTNAYQIPQERVVNVRYGPNIDVKLLRELPTTLERYRARQILFVGGAWERKGGPELVAAFSKVQEVFPNAHLLVIGCSPPINNPAVTVLPKVPLGQLAEFYGRSSLFCMPSRLEPSASVFIEAMHSGLPVVALQPGAVAEIVVNGETGELVHEGDVEGLASALIRLLVDPERTRRMGCHARDVVAKDYVWDAVFDLVGNRIRSLLGGAVRY